MPKAKYNYVKMPTLEDLQKKYEDLYQANVLFDRVSFYYKPKKDL